MSIGDLYPSPYSERGDGFALQAVTHWLRVAPGRMLFGLRAGGLPVALPDVPSGLSHRGIVSGDGGYVTVCDDVASGWLLEHPEVTDRYVTALRAVLRHRHARMNGLATHAVFVGSVELFLGRDLDRVEFALDEDDGSYARALDLLHHAPRDARTAFAMPPEPGTGSFEDPEFLAGDQAWIDGHRLLIEFPPEEGGRVETVAVDRDALAGALENVWAKKTAVEAHIQDALGKLA